MTHNFNRPLSLRIDRIVCALDVTRSPLRRLVLRICKLLAERGVPHV